MKESTNTAASTTPAIIIPTQIASPKSDKTYVQGSATTHVIKTRQAVKCLDLFIRCLQANKSAEVKESILKAYVEEHASELNTRQPAWRIFQYYRPQLIQANLLKTK